MFYTGERAIPWNYSTGWIMTPHLLRYAWASSFCHKKSVVDLACGSGYGAFMLSFVANMVTGVDSSHQAIAYAETRFSASNLFWGVLDMTQRLLAADVYVAFECLEHIDNPAELVAKIDKPLVWSMPVNDGSKFHKRPYTAKQIEDMIGGNIFYQGEDGLIVPRDRAWFAPKYLCGVRE